MLCYGVCCIPSVAGGAKLKSSAGCDQLTIISAARDTPVMGSTQPGLQTYTLKEGPRRSLLFALFCFAFSLIDNQMQEQHDSAF